MHRPFDGLVEPREVGDEAYSSLPPLLGDEEGWADPLADLVRWDTFNDVISQQSFEVLSLVHEVDH